MATATRISLAAAKAAVDAVVDRAENGAGANCIVKLMSGTQPANPTATFTGTTLCSIDLGATTPIFSSATTGAGTQTGYVTANASARLTATGTGAAAAGAGTNCTWFRAYDQGSNAFIDGSVALTGADMSIDNISIASGQQVKLTAWVVRINPDPA